MKSIIVNIPEKEESFFIALLKKFNFEARILNDENKEDYALLTMMYDRENEENVPIETTFSILDKKTKK